jgi:hypothetical protein
MMCLAATTSVGLGLDCVVRTHALPRAAPQVIPLLTVDFLAPASTRVNTCEAPPPRLLQVRYWGVQQPRRSACTAGSV